MLIDRDRAREGGGRDTCIKASHGPPGEKRATNVKRNDRGWKGGGNDTGRPGCRER